MSAEVLESYLSGRWQRGEGVETRLYDPVRGDELATVSAKRLDLAGALAYARRSGQGSLRGMSYGQRAKLLGAARMLLDKKPVRLDQSGELPGGSCAAAAARCRRPYQRIQFPELGPVGEGCRVAPRGCSRVCQARIGNRAPDACHGERRDRGQAAAGRRTEPPLRLGRRSPLGARLGGGG